MRWLLVFLLVLLAMPRVALAQDDLETRREDAKKLADTAYDLMQQGLYSEAISAFRKADERFHSPVFQVYIAECFDKTGKLVAARNALQAVVDEQLAEYAPDSFREAQRDARERLAALDKRIPRVTITLGGARAQAVELDGKPLPDESLGTPLPVDPGSHTVVATAANGRSDRKTFEIRQNERAEVALSFPAEPGAAPDTTAPPSSDTTSSSGRSYIPAAVAFSVGGAGVLIAAIAGGLFVSGADSLKDACESDGDADPNTCPDPNEIDDVKTLGHVTTAGWVIAGVGVATGIVLLFVPLGDDDTARLHITPTGLSVTGRF